MLQTDLFAGRETADTVAYKPDAEQVRARMHRMLAQMAQMTTHSVDASRLSLFRAVFPELAKGLGPAESAVLQAVFDRQLDRLAGAVAPSQAAV